MKSLDLENCVICELSISNASSDSKNQHKKIFEIDVPGVCRESIKVWANDNSLLIYLILKVGCKKIYKFHNMNFCIKNVISNYSDG